MTTFLRLLQSEDKAAALARAVDDLHGAQPSTGIAFEVAPKSFHQIEGTPLVYWVSPGVRALFATLPPFEKDNRKVKQGLATADDFRFVRCSWESPFQGIGSGTEHTTQAEYHQQTFQNKRWVPFAKGGAYAPYYGDIHLLAKCGS